MADLILTIKVMPKSPDVDLTAVEESAKEIISQFEGRGTKAEIEPVAFGLKALNLTFAYDESKGSTDALEQKLTEIDGVNSAEVTKIDRALG